MEDLFDKENLDPVKCLIDIAEILELKLIDSSITPAEVTILTKINKELSPYALSAQAAVLAEVSDSVHVGLTGEELIAVERLQNKRISKQ